MNKVVKPTRPYTRGLTGKELASLSDDDIDYSDIPDSTDEQLKRAIGVPGGHKMPISKRFFAYRKKLVARHPCVGSDGIDYRYLQPDAEFWREATFENINEAMDRLIARRREEVRSGSAGSPKTDSHKKTSSRVSV